MEPGRLLTGDGRWPVGDGAGGAACDSARRPGLRVAQGREGRGPSRPLHMLEGTGAPATVHFHSAQHKAGDDSNAMLAQASYLLTSRSICRSPRAVKLHTALQRVRLRWVFWRASRQGAHLGHWLPGRHPEELCPNLKGSVGLLGL